MKVFNVFYLKFILFLLIIFIEILVLLKWIFIILA